MGQLQSQNGLYWKNSWGKKLLFGLNLRLGLGIRVSSVVKVRVSSVVKVRVRH